MFVYSSLFECLDLLDLWHLYGLIKRAGKVRNVSISKVSRRSRDLLSELGFRLENDRGAPDPQLLRRSSTLAMLRIAYQRWRLECGQLKVLPVFVASAPLMELQNLDVLPDVYLEAEVIADHLQERRIDLMISSSLDLAGELIQAAQRDPQSPYVAIPLFADEVMLALNPEHPLAGLREVTPEDCQPFPSAAYPDGIARLGAEELRRRGLWRFACRRSSFDAQEWFLGMRSPKGLCYRTGLLLDLLPDSADLTPAQFSQPLMQTTYVLMLRELATEPVVETAVAKIRRSLLDRLARGRHAFTPR